MPLKKGSSKKTDEVYKKLKLAKFLARFSLSITCIGVLIVIFSYFEPNLGQRAREYVACTIKKLIHISDEEINK